MTDEQVNDDIVQFPFQRSKHGRELSKLVTETRQKNFETIYNYFRKNRRGNDPDPFDRKISEYTLEEAWFRLDALEGLALGTRTMEEDEIWAVSMFAAHIDMPIEPMPEAALRYYFRDIKMMLGEAFLALAIANDERDGKED
jgi:hypothetical protein